MIGQILNGQLHTQARPGDRTRADAEPTIDIDSAYGRGRGSPGGWWIPVEPEIYFVTD